MRLPREKLTMNMFHRQLGDLADGARGQGTFGTAYEGHITSATNARTYVKMNVWMPKVIFCVPFVDFVFFDGDEVGWEIEHISNSELPALSHKTVARGAIAPIKGRNRRFQRFIY